jgi:hypothetical protein
MPQSFPVRMQSSTQPGSRYARPAAPHQASPCPERCPTRLDRRAERLPGLGERRVPGRQPALRSLDGMGDDPVRPVPIASPSRPDLENARAADNCLRICGEVLEGRERGRHFSFGGNPLRQNRFCGRFEG